MESTGFLHGAWFESRIPWSLVRIWTAERPVKDNVPYHPFSRGCETERVIVLFQLRELAVPGEDFDIYQISPCPPASNIAQDRKFPIWSTPPRVWYRCFIKTISIIGSAVPGEDFDIYRISPCPPANNIPQDRKLLIWSTPPRVWYRCFQQNNFNNWICCSRQA